MPASISSSVAREFERLDLGHNTGMAPQTRAMRKRAERSHRSSATGSAGPSTSTARGHRQIGRERESTSEDRNMTPEEDEDDDDGDDDDGDDDEEEGGDGNGGRPSIFWDIWASNEPSFLTPRELAALNPADHSSPHTTQTRRYKALGDIFSQIFDSNPNVARRANAALPADYRVNQLVSNMHLRYKSAMDRLQENRLNPANGADVNQTLNNLRSLFLAVSGLVRDHPNKSRELADLLVSILTYVIEHDVDLYTGTTRPLYLDASHHGNLYRRFISEHGQPLYFLQVIAGLSDAALRPQRARLNDMYTSLWTRHPELRQSSAQATVPTLPDELRVYRVWKSLASILSRVTHRE